MTADRILSILNAKKTGRDDSAESFLERCAGKSVYIYGGGSVGREIARVLARSDIQTQAIIDKNATLLEPIPGLEIIDFVDLMGRIRTQGSNAVCIIGVFNTHVDCCSLVQMLNPFFSEVITFNEVYSFFYSEFGDRYWLTHPSYYDSYVDELLKVYALLEDEVSRDVFLQNLCFRITGKYEILSKPYLANQYFPDDVPQWGSPLRIIDCGAFVGDTLQTMHDLNINVEAYVGFEPDPENFSKLKGFTGDFLKKANSLSECVLYPCAVSDGNEMLRFANGFSAASQLSQAGEGVIQCVSLDDVLPVFKPNLIKMDIEGAELDALKGASNIITKHLPGLAVCVYHKPDDLWTIPFYIDELKKDSGRFFLRSHGYNGFDLVLYWLAK